VRLLLDEMLSPQVARALRDRGHDVVAIAERQVWMSYSDDEVIELAREERRAVVTANVRDYRPRSAAAAMPGRPGHFGMVFIPGSYRITKHDIGRIVRALEAVLAAHASDADLHNQETWLAHVAPGRIGEKRSRG
jgi:hypothetical protein